MQDIEEQIALISEGRERRLNKTIKEDFGRHLRFIGRFLKRHKVLAISAGILLFSQSVIEVLLIFFSKNKLSDINLNQLDSFFWIFISLASLVFIISSFFSIKQEKTLIVLLINELRRKIFKNYLNRPTGYMNCESKAGVIAKISYHLPLLSMGASSSFFGIVRWFIYVPIILIISYFAEINIFLVLTIVVGLSFIIAAIAYLIVRRYVSREVTFYSQIIRHIDVSLSEKYFFKNFRLEPKVIKKMDDLVDLDSVFRVRRDLWFKMGAKIMMIILLLGAVLGQIFYGDILAKINLINPSLKFLYLFLAIYFSRILYEALQVGLYFFPAKLGLSLANVKTKKYLRPKDILKLKTSLAFYSRKIKLFQEGRYYKNANWEFNSSGRYLITGAGFSGKTSLAKTMAGRDIYNSKALKVRFNGQRMDYAEYKQMFVDYYFFDPGFSSERSLLEVMTGHDRENISQEKIVLAMDIVAAEPYLSQLISSNKNFSASSKRLWSAPSSAFALHVLICLIKKPSLIIIDNFWLDLSYPEINKALQILDKYLTESIIIVFSRNNNNVLNYQKTYDLDISLS